ncbi:RNA polymerase sigma factor [Loigolactobacillus backii]|uniref:Uncharacterized protein n=1 Tax=Loigolactobacillus backii TaxID=375175 RepID=A0A192H1H6_9LACO|nr:helix-turn-helix domain-containing protein [Loigolactobacillus backii]ANK62128.1 hypothetical protein AYR53_04690 [Loigolactobacillus backii]ANK68677.1 hypothetical protein AYR56_00030 [Loigolactobacillus backii]MDA5386680.1 sigma-70 family RNA polymerase sigma factor [Loigolactobacillus backii]MDA5389205.1 sigma-70 family RNA polymerase sigma factor [Loigolactobacillus backii]
MNEKDKQRYKAAFNLLQDHNRLIHGALRHCGVPQSWQDYSDLFNECRLTFVDTYCEFVEKYPAKDETDCLNYIYTALIWMIYKVLRRNRVESYYITQDQSVLVDESKSFDLRVTITSADVFEEVHVEDVYRDLFSRCDSAEKQFIVLRCLEDQPIKVITERLGCSKRHVYRLRDRVALKVLRVVGGKK